MISNLINAISIALFSSVLTLGGYKSDVIQFLPLTQGTSWVTGTACDVFASGHVSQGARPQVTIGTYHLYDYGGNELDEDGFGNSNIGNLVDFYSGLDENYVSSSTETYIFAWGALSTPVRYNDVNYYLALRVGVPFESDISGFEFRSNANCIIYQYSLTNVGLFVPYQYRTKVDYTTSIGIYDYTAVSHNDNGTPSPAVIESTDNVYFPYKLSTYLIVFGANNNTAVDLEMDFQFNNAGIEDYNLGYQNGYSNGYDSGVKVGYTNGWNDAISSTSGGTFHGLFNAIADTPLRFLYGLFNFDLFGISVLVIVLSLLTGIILFGIVKKFWK